MMGGWLKPETALALARVMGSSSSRLAEALISAFRVEIELPSLAPGTPTWAAQGDAWRFLTGPDQEIERVARRFGMNYWPEEGLIAHTSETSVIARDGSLAARINGSGFAATQLGDLIAHELERK